MRLDELCGPLQKAYSKKRGFGTEKVDKAGYENIWFVVPPSPPTEIPPGLLPGPIGEANKIWQARPNFSQSSELDKLIAFLFIRREALSSSRMEGTWSTIDAVLHPESTEDEEEKKSGRNSVRDYAHALEFGFKKIVRHGLSALDEKLIIKLHKLVMSRDPEFKGVPGQIRKKGLAGDVVQIGAAGRKEDSIYNPAPPSHVKRCLEDVLSWHRDETLIELGEAGMGMSLPVRMAIGHTHFEAVHPFSDGNGRIGRMIWPLQMVASNKLPLYLSGYIEKNSAAYSKALQAAQKHLSYKEIVEFVSKAMIGASEEEAQTKKAILALPESWETRGRFRKNSAALRALPHLIEMPIITGKDLAQRLDISVQASINALNQLEEQKILRERTGYGRNRIFAAEEVISLLAREFSSDTEIALEGARYTLGIK